MPRPAYLLAALVVVVLVAALLSLAYAGRPGEAVAAGAAAVALGEAARRRRQGARTDLERVEVPVYVDDLAEREVAARAEVEEDTLAELVEREREVGR